MWLAAAEPCEAGWVSGSARAPRFGLAAAARFRRGTIGDGAGSIASGSTLRA